MLFFLSITIVFIIKGIYEQLLIFYDHVQPLHTHQVYACLILAGLMLVVPWPKRDISKDTKEGYINYS